MRNKEEKQVDQLLTNANQSLNFLRTVLDDLFLAKNKLSKAGLQRVYEAQKNYRIHKAVLTNTESLLYRKKLPLSERLSTFLVNNLRVRISKIIEEAIELDRLR